MKQYRPVVDWPEYQISDEGDVVGRNGPIRTFAVHGYLAFNVMRGKARKSLRVHREMLKAFYGDMPGLCARHRNDDPLDNRLSNLAWGTHRQNESDKRSNGGSLIGERHHQARLKIEQVRQIRASSERGTEIATRFGITPSQVCAIRRGRSWRHAT